MSISQQIDDAKFLAANGRHLGALTILMLAIAASSRKRFPKPTPSMDTPGKEMGDGEAFKLFLGGRINNLFFDELYAPDIGKSGVFVGSLEKRLSIEHIFYKYYRNGLVHQAELPSEVGFRNDGGGQGSVGIYLSENCVILDAGWIDALINAVVHARVNGTEFGIKHYDFVFQHSDEESFINSICERYGITPGRFNILKHIAQIISPEQVSNSSDGELRKAFQALIDNGNLTEEKLTGLRNRNIMDDHHRLLDNGLQAIRDIALLYKVVRVV